MVDGNTAAASFSFTRYLVRRLFFDLPSDPKISINIEFHPSGIYYQSQGLYQLTLRFYAKHGAKSDLIMFDLITEGIFSFEPNTPIGNFPEYFYPNSIAILYPYVRAFITTVTAVGSDAPLILPTLNLALLGKPLQESTTVEN
jgi:preprotein translocase subunit SecB